MKVNKLVIATIVVLFATVIFGVLAVKNRDEVVTEYPVAAPVTKPAHRYTIICLDGIEYWERRHGSSHALAPHFNARGYVVQCTSN